MRILIVDENADFCSVLREYLREGLEKAAAAPSARVPGQLAVKEWHPVGQGVPAEGVARFKWNFDALIVNGQSEGTNTLDWLSRARQSAGANWPTVLLLVGGPQAEALTAGAARLGVTHTVARLQLTPQRLFNALMAAVAFGKGEGQPPSALASTGAPIARGNTSTGNLSTLSPEAIPPRRPVEPAPGAQPVPAPTTPALDAQAAAALADQPTQLNPSATKPRSRKAKATPEIRGYKIDRMIGEGGTSRVFLAHRESDNLEVVLKVLLPELASDPSIVSRFMQEFSLIQKIKSAHVTRIFDLNYDSGNAYLAMEYFGAGDLRERIIAGGMSPVQALKIFAQIARALGAIHDAGVVHRDLKPHNVMFRDQKYLAIVDFGGAKSLGETAGITKVGHVIGTPNYMSPEQITGAAVDLRSDLYSLGVILHLLLTGQTLYVAPSPTELMEMHLHAPIPRLPEELNGFQKLLNKLVAKDPEARFQSARELYAYIAY
jgi:serine/threonine-protein kinase PpkA